MLKMANMSFLLVLNYKHYSDLNHALFTDPDISQMRHENPGQAFDALKIIFIHEYGFGCLVSANLTCS